MRSQPIDTGLRSVTGQVSSAGAVNIPGTADWIVSRSAAGTYAVRFLRPFRLRPVGVTAALGANFTANNASAEAVMDVFTFNAAGAAADASFNFQVEGR